MSEAIDKLSSINLSEVEADLRPRAIRSREPSEFKQRWGVVDPILRDGPAGPEFDWYWDTENEAICPNEVCERTYIRASELKTPARWIAVLAHLEEKSYMTNDCLGELVRHMLDHAGFWVAQPPELPKHLTPKQRADLRWRVFARDNYRCQVCGQAGEHGALTIDHIQPKSRGGADNTDNLQTLCWSCNARKGNRHS